MNRMKRKNSNKELAPIKKPDQKSDGVLEEKTSDAVFSSSK